MGDVSAGSGEARVPGEAVNADGSMDTGEANAAGAAAPEPLDFEATVIRATPLQPGSNAKVVPVSPIGGQAAENQAAGNQAAETRDAENWDATAPGVPSPLRSNMHPTASSAATLAPNAPAQHGPTPAVARGSGASAILLEIGTLLGGRYELLQLLGEGGMGAVYKAADREVDRIVALKVIRPQMAANPEILARFKQELLLSSKVTHRNVIRIYDLGEAHGVRFITMEYVEGETLHHIMKQRKKLEIVEAVDIMEQVASGLAAAHREGIIHRDLKPANIMLDQNGRVVVMDFGLARTFSGDGMTQTGMMLGTMEYMSPEQAQGIDVKASSDIFAVGLILYELLAGTTPFYAESAVASLLMRTQHRAAPLVNVDRNIPGALSNIVVKCLEKDPAKRYQSAEHLDADLRAWQSGAGMKSISATATQMRVNRMRELPWLRIGIVSALVVATGAGGLWYLHGRRQAAESVAHSPVSVLIGDFANHTGDSVLDNTLEPMLGVAMEGASFINVYSRGDARKLAKKLPNPTDILDEQSSRLVAMNQGVNAVITGDISLRDDQYYISAVELDSVSGKMIAKAEVIAPSKQDVLSELPKLAVPIRKALGDNTPASVQFEKVSGGFIASSLEAVHQDALGVEAQFAGRYQDAFNFFQASANLDPKFARAYSGMAAMANNLGRPGDAVKYMELAMQNVDRMTERERYRNQGLLYLTMGDWQNCVQQYTRLIARYPADRVGQNNLATCYTQLRNAPAALKAARSAVEIVPRGVGPRLNLAFISVFAGDFAGGEKAAREGLEISPSAWQGYLTLAEAQLGQGQIKNAAESYGQFQKSGPLGASGAADGLADLAAYRGNNTEAARILSEGAATDVASKMTDNAAAKYASLGNIEELQANHPGALAALGKALANSQSTQIQFLAATVYAHAGELLRAQKLATALSAQPSSEPRAYGMIITGMVALKRNDTAEAVKQITAANQLLDTWIGRYELGLADLQAGSFAEADAQFEQCIKRRGEAMELFVSNVPTYSYFPPVYYYQGRAREGMKSPGFTDSYKTYLGIREESSEDPLVLDARHRISQ